MKHIGPAVVMGVAGLVIVTACSSSVSGSGHGSQSVSPSGAPTSAAATGSVPASAVNSAPAPSATPPTSATHSHSAASSGATSGASSGTTVAGPAQVTNVSYVVHCTSATDTAGTVQLTWASTGATDIYVLEGPTASALVGANAKTSGGKGPFAPNGSSSLPFDCSQTDDYYLVEAYNSSDGSNNGRVQQVPFS